MAKQRHHDVVDGKRLQVGPGASTVDENAQPSSEWLPFVTHWVLALALQAADVTKQHIDAVDVNDTPFSVRSAGVSSKKSVV